MFIDQAKYVYEYEFKRRILEMCNSARLRQYDCIFLLAIRGMKQEVVGIVDQTDCCWKETVLFLKIKIHFYRPSV